jgi:hypothetical protein
MKRKMAILVLCLTFMVVSAVSAEIRTATFDSIVTGTNLNGYTEGNLIISTPTTAYVAYYTSTSGIFPSASPTYPGFSGGFFYPIGGVSAPITVKPLDNADMYDVKFNAGSGFTGDADEFVSWNIWDDGSIVSTGSLTVLKGDQVDIAYHGGFDSIDLYARNAEGGSTNALALDNLIVNTSLVSRVPEPATMLLFGLGLVGLAGVRRYK